MAALKETAAKGIPQNSRATDGHPIALLSIARLNLEVPVFVGTDQRTLNHGAGVIDGTALPGHDGNTAISAHRDSFFRPLKDIEIGDVIELRASSGLQRFQVSEVFITDPLDVSVLDPADGQMLTLITCYPFYYVGFAPDRFIVRARPQLATAEEDGGRMIEPTRRLK
ncbi:MAG: class D sortase [Pseudomonadales bacterium]